MKTFGKILLFIFGALMIVCGFYYLFHPTDAFATVGYIIGISMIFEAIGTFCYWGELRRAGLGDGWLLFGAIVSLVLGFYVLNSPRTQVGIDIFVAYYVAAWLFVDGIVLICRAHKIRKFHKNWDTVTVGTHWYLPLILGILMGVLGVLCMFKPLISATMLGVFMALGIILSGCGMITIATTASAETE